MKPVSVRTQVHRQRMFDITGNRSAINIQATYADGESGHFLTGPNSRKTAVRERILGVVSRCEEIAKRRYGSTSKTIVRVDFSKFRRRSWGGRYGSRWGTERTDLSETNYRDGGISIVVGCYVNLQKEQLWQPGTYGEYKSLAPWGDVGDLKTAVPLDVVTVHEMAHSIVSTNWQAVLEREELPQRPLHMDHGLEFMTVYSRLRHELGMINPNAPIWLTMPLEARVASAAWRRVPPTHLMVFAAAHPSKYRKTRRTVKQRNSRAAKRQAVSNKS